METASATSGFQKVIYLDHNATTPLAPSVKAAITAALETYGNPSSTHRIGKEASAAAALGRRQVADFLGAEPDGVVFTASASEANNLAIKGVLAATGGEGHVITSRIEHSATLETCRYLEGRGVAVTYLPVDGTGRVDPDDVRANLRPDTRLIAIMTANNETGTIQPVEAIGAVAREAGVPFFTDAVQAAGKLPVHLGRSPIELLSISGHKLYGPKGIGVLAMRRGVHLAPLVHGGGQERGLRAGTENVLGIIGLAAACAESAQRAPDEAERIRRLRNRLWDRVRDLGDVRLNGALDTIVPGTLNVSFRSLRGESLALALSLEHVAVSTGSACHATRVEPSHVLKAMGVPEAWLHGSIRFSVGHDNTEEEIDHAAAVVARVVRRLRAMLPGRSKIAVA